MNVRVRAIVIKDDKVVLMHRRKLVNNDLKEYYALPGGGIEENDISPEDALRRELKEELNIEINEIEPVTFSTENNIISLIYACKYVSGDLEIIGEEKDRNIENNHYEIRELTMNDLDSGIDLYFIDLIKKYLNK
jgi:ADP-ribose pyrophosphatase YjhB (NUDIX family)